MTMPQSPPHEGYGNIPYPNDPTQFSRGYGMSADSRPASYIANQFLQRSESQMSHNSIAPSRSGTLKKKASLSRKGGLKRSSSRRSLRAGSVRSLNLGEREKYGSDDPNSAFYVPIPTTGSPTEELANRFQGLIEANKAKEVESEVILQLTGLRSDLQQKTKEIKSLSGDFKNSVDKEVDSTRKAVRNLQESLGLVDVDPSATSGRHDPFILRLQVDKQIDKQIEEENYLHRAYLNLENSGRELEAIVVGEIQKAYNAYASILKREADVALDAIEKLRAGPISMPKDHEWNNFITESEHLVDPRIPIRSFENITYPGRDHPAAAEVRSGMLERKSKYLKSYTPGWYVLSPTHLHEFKSADRVAFQTPVMSLYLPEQKLGSHSQPDSSSHKFMLKGRQTGAMHRGHAWVFRAESYDTMMAWFDDIASLSEKTGEARNAFVRNHVRSLSGRSIRPGSISSDGVMDEDEADQTPYSSQSAVLRRASLVKGETPAQRPQPGGRFPSDVQIDRHLQATMSLSSGESSGAREALADAVSLSGSGVPYETSQQPPQEINQLPYRPAGVNHETYGTWIEASTTADQYPDHTQEQINHQQPVTSASQAPIVVASEPTTDRREWAPENVPQAPTNGTISASGGQTGVNAPSLNRQESQRSRQTHSTYSLLASTPTTEATSPLTDNTNGMASAQSKESPSTIDMLKMPGRYPRQMTG
uniref:Phosphatidylinositol 4,5-bisphosphate-binding protein SLM1 n=1 Tax=Talaromyces marneffei PM1 TaxID=1077442 RepID=A0A093UVE9_TALMA